MEKLISIDLYGDFGFFRKPDANNTINLSYNVLHKPAILGILGAIIGLDGYKEKGKIPEYYMALENIKIGIEPLRHEKGNYSKTMIKYSNTVGYANNGATYLTEEATLIKPAYKIYLLLNDTNSNEQKLFEYLQNAKAEYIPYFGKNEFAVWWLKESFKIYDFEKIDDLKNSICIKTIFLKDDVIKENKADPIFDLFAIIEDETPFMFFERLPKGFDKDLFQYKMGDFVLTSFALKSTLKIDNLFCLKNSNLYVQLI